MALALRGAVEWLFLFAGIAFGIGLVVPWLVLVVVPLVCLGRHLARSRGARLALNGLFLLLVLFALNALALLWLFLYRAGIPYIALYAVSVVAAGWVFLRLRPAGLRWYHGAMLSLIGVLFVEVTVLTAVFSDSECDEVRRNPGVRLLLDHSRFPDLNKVPRFFATDGEERTLFVGYREPFLGNRASRGYGIFVVDLRTGETRLADLKGGEPIGMAYDPVDEGLVAALVFHPELEQPHEATLAWVGRGGRLEREWPFPFHRWNSYYCAIEPRDDQIEVVVGDKDPAVLLLDRAGGLISRHPIEMAGMIAIESVLPAGNRLYLSFGSSFLNMLFAPGVVALERPSYAVAARSPSFVCGTYVLALDGPENRIYTNTQWGGDLYGLDPSLRVTRRIPLGGAFRALAIDSERRRAYVPGYVDGELVALDLDSGRHLGAIRIGKGGRALHVLRGGEVVAGSGCGVVEVPPSAFDTAADS